LVYPLQASRLQHTLGVLSLVAHFYPNDHVLRTAALLHDVGHFPFCHSAELVAGVDHHEMTRQWVTQEPILGILRAHGLDAEALLALMDGDPPNALRNHNGSLHLDHLDSWARQAQAAGYAEMPAHELLARLRLVGNVVAADRATCEYLARLIRQGNERHYAEGDIGPATILAHVLTLALGRGVITQAELAEATDAAILAHLTAGSDKQIMTLIDVLLKEPWRITVEKLSTDNQASAIGSDYGNPEQRSPSTPLLVHLNKLYNAVPVEIETGQPITQVSEIAQAELARIEALVGTYAISWT
jgi:hypothetical protein